MWYLCLSHYATKNYKEALYHYEQIERLEPSFSKLAQINKSEVKHKAFIQEKILIILMSLFFIAIAGVFGYNAFLKQQKAEQEAEA